MAKFRAGDKVKMTKAALENYGAEYAGQVFTVGHVATQYMPAAQFYAAGQPAGFHPGYDESAAPAALYDFEELTFSLYDWEIAPAR